MKASEAIAQLAERLATIERENRRLKDRLDRVTAAMDHFGALCKWREERCPNPGGTRRGVSKCEACKYAIKAEAVWQDEFDAAAG